MKTTALLSGVAFFATACVGFAATLVNSFEIEVDDSDIIVTSVEVISQPSVGIDSYIGEIVLQLDGFDFRHHGSCRRSDNNPPLSFDLIDIEDSSEVIDILTFDVTVEDLDYDVIIDDLVLEVDSVPEPHTSLLLLVSALGLRRRR